MRRMGYVHEALVQRNVLVHVGISAPDLVYLAGGFRIFMKIRVHVNAVRAAAVGFLYTHGGTHAVLPRLVAACGNDAPLRRQRADNQGLARKLRVVPYLYGRVEGIHIHADDFPVHALLHN